MTPAHRDGHILDERTATALGDFLTFAEEVETVIVAEGREAFFASRVRQLAAEALLQKLGQSANRLGRDFRDEHPEIPWRAIRGMRNVVAHEYHLVDYDILWRTMEVSLPPVADQIRRILAR